jgi:uncharacterized protein YndB with AHSA1/START domain
MDINRDAPATAEGEIQIAASPETVWEVISAIEAWPSWNPDVKSIAGWSPRSRLRLQVEVRSRLVDLPARGRRRAARDRVDR